MGYVTWTFFFFFLKVCIINIYCASLRPAANQNQEFMVWVHLKCRNTMFLSYFCFSALFFSWNNSVDIKVLSYCWCVFCTKITLEEYLKNLEPSCYVKSSFNNLRSQTDIWRTPYEEQSELKIQDYKKACFYS